MIEGMTLKRSIMGDFREDLLVRVFLEEREHNLPSVLAELVDHVTLLMSHPAPACSVAASFSQYTDGCSFLCSIRMLSVHALSSRLAVYSRAQGDIVSAQRPWLAAVA